jgi:hypothetical protein
MSANCSSPSPTASLTSGVNSVAMPFGAGGSAFFSDLLIRTLLFTIIQGYEIPGRRTIRRWEVHVSFAPYLTTACSFPLTRLSETPLSLTGRNQSCGNAKGIRTWIARKDSVVNEDVVVWHTFGLTHQPRVEDFVCILSLFLGLF